jgi:hypothetical protein
MFVAVLLRFAAITGLASVTEGARLSTFDDHPRHRAVHTPLHMETP